MSVYDVTFAHSDCATQTKASATPSVASSGSLLSYRH